MGNIDLYRREVEGEIDVERGKQWQNFMIYM